PITARASQTDPIPDTIIARVARIVFVFDAVVTLNPRLALSIRDEQLHRAVGGIENEVRFVCDGEIAHAKNAAPCSAAGFFAGQYAREFRKRLKNCDAALFRVALKD